jgi:hypothetical protein
MEKQQMKIKSYNKKQVGEVSKEYAENMFNELLAFQGYGFNKCLDPYSTFVTLKNGKTVSLDEIKVGDFIKNETGNFVEVTDKWYGKNEMYEVTLEDNKKIICSMEHKFKTEKGVYPLKYIIENNLKIATI